jgi:hypothetical protein
MGEVGSGESGAIPAKRAGLCNGIFRKGRWMPGHPHQMMRFDVFGGQKASRGSLISTRMKMDDDRE